MTAFAGASLITSNPAEQKSVNDFTLMIYMNGSDLESRHHLASDDLAEMTQTLPPEGFETVILTGGTKEWHSNDIDEKSLSIHSVTDSGFSTLKKSEMNSIGDSDTLAKFLQYTIEEHPAKRYGLLFWNHGNGSVNGFGYDELYDYDSLTLMELEEGLRGGAEEGQLAFIGFDACLMANVEVADAVSPYADYLIASQELEPGDGWNYNSFLPTMYEKGFNVEETLTTIADDFVKIENSEEMRTLSVIDLKKYNSLNRALNQFSMELLKELGEDKFTEIAERRSRIKAFGQPGFLYKGPDMIDIKDMADQFSDLLPDETDTIKKALEDCVVAANGNEAAGINGGLSIYFPYQNKRLAKSADSYYNSNFNKSYQNMITGFTEKLLEDSKKPKDLIAQKDHKIGDIQLVLSQIKDIDKIYAVLLRKIENYYIVYGHDSDIDIDFDTGTISSNFSGEWLTLNGIAVSVYTREHNDEILTYTVPILLNGEMAELVITYDEENPQGIVKGIRIIGEISGKGFVSLEQGDKITFLYEVYQSSPETKQEEKHGDLEKKYYEGDVIEYSGDEKFFQVDIGAVPEGVYRFGFSVVDFYQNQFYTNFHNYKVK